MRKEPYIRILIYFTQIRKARQIFYTLVNRQRTTLFEQN